MVFSVDFISILWYNYNIEKCRINHKAFGNRRMTWKQPHGEREAISPTAWASLFVYGIGLPFLC